MTSKHSNMKTIKTITLYYFKNKLAITLLASCFFLVAGQSIWISLSLWDSSIINTSMMKSIIEIIMISFAIYYWTDNITQEFKNKTIYLLLSKNRNPKQIIFGKIAAILYTTIALTLWLVLIYTFWNLVHWLPLLNSDYTEFIIIGIKALTVFYLSQFFALFLSRYITILTTFLIYIVSHSADFLLFSLEKNGSWLSPIGNILQVVLPNFDSLSSLAISNINTYEIITIILSIFIYNIFIIALSILALRSKFH